MFTNELKVTFAGYEHTTVECRHIKAAMQRLAVTFGGVNLTENLGGYVMRNGELVIEKSFSLSVLCSGSGFEVSYFKGVCDELNTVFNQECVLFTNTKLDGELIFNVTR